MARKIECNFVRLQLLAVGVVMTLTVSAFGQGKEPSPLSVHERLAKLEAQNALLMEQLRKLQNANRLRDVGAGSGLSRDEIQKLISDFVAKKEAERKREDAARIAVEKLLTEQQKREEAQRVEVGLYRSATTRWKHRHIFFESPNKDFNFALTGRLHWDTGWYDNTPGMPILQDASAFRRARIGMEGLVWDNVHFRMAYDFANPNNGSPTTNFRDAYVQILDVPILGNVQAGQFKELMSLSWSSTSNGLTFLERPLPVNAFVPGRNVGLAIHRNFLDDRIWAGSGIFRSGGNSGAFSQGDSQYGWTSRLTALPIYAQDGRVLVHVGGSYSRRSFAADNGPRFSTRGESRIGTPRIIDSGQLLGARDLDIFGGEFASVIGPLSFQAEALFANANIPNRGSHSFWGAYAQASYFLTGEHRQYHTSTAGFDTVVPFENYSFARNGQKVLNGLGAWEIALRWSYVDVSSEGFFTPTGQDLSGGTGTLNDVTFGLNWYLNPQCAVMFNYIHGWRDSDTAGADGESDTLAVRLLLWF